MKRMLASMGAVLLLWGCANEPPAPVPALRAVAESANRAAVSAAQALRWENAVRSWKEALSVYQAIDDWEGQGRARLGLAHAYARLGRDSEAESNLLFMMEQEAFPRLQRARASYQLAQLAARKDEGLAILRLEEARRFCGADCLHVSAFDNLQARLSAARSDWLTVERLAGSVLTRRETSGAERAHALRLLAEAQFGRGQMDMARIYLGQALALDRELAEPEWLFEDYRLLERIAVANGDTGLQVEVATRIASLCRGAKLVGCSEEKQTKP